MTTSILVLGIGNTLLSDEGIGVHVVHHLAATCPYDEGITFLDGGTLSFTLAEQIASHSALIVVDAARWGEVPGTVRCVEGAEMDHYLGGNRASVHEVGLTDLLDIARLSGTCPEYRALVGIEPASFAWSDRPSEAVADSVPVAAEMVIALCRAWHDDCA